VTIIDISILVGILLFVALGVRDGFFKKLYGILGFFGGLIAATKLMSPLADVFIDSLGFSEEAGLIVSFFLIFVFFMILVNLLYRWFGKSAAEHMNFWSRIAGGFLGAAQGVVAVSLILVMLSIFDIPDADAKESSVLYDDTVQVAPKIFDYTTRWLPDSKKFFDEIKGKIRSLKLP